MIKAVLFDFDGTIMDTNEIILESWRHVFKEFRGRVCADEEVLGSFGEILEDTMRQTFPDIDTKLTVESYRNFQRTLYKDRIKLCDGIDGLVKGLYERGIKVAIVTSRFRGSTIEGAQRFGIAEYITDYVGCDDTKAHKPNPEPLNIALEKLGVTKDEAIYVGDSKYDIQCAHNAGMKAVLVNWTICLAKKDRVGINKADFEIDTAGDLFDIIDKL